MKGLIFRTIQKLAIWNMLLILLIAIIEIYLNFNELSKLHIIFIIIKIHLILDKFIFTSEFLYIYIVTFLIINIYIIIWTLKNWRYINIPYLAGLNNILKNFDSSVKKQNIYFDKFIKKEKRKDYLIENYSLYFKNWVSIDKKKYEENINVISQYLKWEGEIKIESWKRKGIKLNFYKLPIMIEACILDYTKGYISFGYSKDGNYKIHLSKITSAITVGESGCGKSNVMHNIINSLIINKEFISSIELIDLKGTELNRYNEFKYMNFIDTIPEVKDKLLFLKEEMEKRFSRMKERNLQTYNGKFIFIIIDEIATIGVQPKKIRDEIFNIMTELANKGRASRILLWIFTQKLSSDSLDTRTLNSLQTKLLMKTTNQFNITSTFENKESLERITLVSPHKFPKGRVVIKNGYDSSETLVQTPFIKFNKNSS